MKHPLLAVVTVSAILAACHAPPDAVHSPPPSGAEATSAPVPPKPAGRQAGLPVNPKVTMRVLD